MMSARNAETTKSTAITIVALKITFSKPLRVCWTELKLSPPNALPKLASLCWSKIPAMRNSERIICMYGRKFLRIIMWKKYTRTKRESKFSSIFLFLWFDEKTHSYPHFFDKKWHTYNV